MHLRYLLCLTMISALALSGIQAAEIADDAVKEYVDRYKDIAVDEMVRTGIPASIKLAQAVLESNAGRSYLAVNGNNHFGIKCGGSWKGRTIMREDDDYKNGKLIKSCFRAFPSVSLSFKAHSEFLMDPRKEYRYGSLFDLDPMDYKAWAKGLKKAGYATNPKYPDLLISIIERHQLYLYDQLSMARISKDLIEPDIIAIEEQIEDQPETPIDESALAVEADPVAKKSGKEEFFTGVAASYEELEFNKTKYIQAQHGDNLEIIALETGHDLSDLLVYNDDGYRPSEPLEKGAKIYIERKRSKFSGGEKTYVAQTGESVFEVAQKFGIRLEKLLKRNDWNERHRLHAGDVVYLRGKRR